MTILADKREVKAIQLLAKGNNVKIISQAHYAIRSQTTPNKWYDIIWQKDRWSCQCPDYQKRLGRCKHLHALDYFLMIRDITKGMQEQDDQVKCKYCGSSEHLVKYGPRHRQSVTTQMFKCKSCEKYFTNRKGYERMKNQKIAVLSALDLYFRGISLREIQQHLKSTFGCNVSYVTIYNWLKKYVQLVKRYTENLRFNTSDRWHADETLIRVGGRQMVLWNLLDSETKQWIAKHISETRGKEDAVILFKKGKNRSENPPKEIITDGLPSYPFAIDDQFGSNQNSDSNQKTIHIVGPLVGKINNNRIERFNGSVKGRLKPMGHLNNNVGADLFTDGFEIHYNFIREHLALNGKTPYGASKGSDEGLNWRQLIDKASAKDSNVKT